MYGTVEGDSANCGNGPCPALGPCGCRLKKYRPITCTTQLCSKMLAVLKELGLIDAPTRSALQIEDLVTLVAGGSTAWPRGG